MTEPIVFEEETHADSFEAELDSIMQAPLGPVSFVSTETPTEMQGNECVEPSPTKVARISFEPIQFGSMPASPVEIASDLLISPEYLFVSHVESAHSGGASPVPAANVSASPVPAANVSASPVPAANVSASPVQDKTVEWKYRLELLDLHIRSPGSVPGIIYPHSFPGMPSEYNSTGIFKLGESIYCAGCGIFKRLCVDNGCCRDGRHKMSYMISQNIDQNGAVGVWSDPYFAEIHRKMGTQTEQRLALFEAARLYPGMFQKITPDYVSKHKNYVGVPYLSKMGDNIFCSKCGMVYHLCKLKNTGCPRHDGAGAGPAQP